MLWLIDIIGFLLWSFIGYFVCIDFLNIHGVGVLLFSFLWNGVGVVGLIFLIEKQYHIFD
jgi:hypothetical protein